MLWPCNTNSCETHFSLGIIISIIIFQSCSSFQEYNIYKFNSSPKKEAGVCYNKGGKKFDISYNLPETYKLDQESIRSSPMDGLGTPYRLTKE